MLGGRPERGDYRQAVEHKLAMAEGHAPGQAGRSRGVEGRRAGILVKIRERESRGCRRDQRLIFPGYGATLRTALRRHQSRSSFGRYPAVPARIPSVAGNPH